MNNISILNAQDVHIKDCKASLGDCLLGDIYFSDANRTELFISEGIKKGELYIAQIDNSECAGFMRIEPNFAFSGFPLLRAIAVKPEYRGKRIGGLMLDFYEHTAYANSPKLFLFVSELNEKAQKLYKKKGYVQVGSIPGFYAADINEYLFMKQK